MPPARWRASAWNRSARQVVGRSVPLSARSRRRGGSGTDLPRRGYGLCMASPYIEFAVGDRVVKVTNPDKVYFPEIGGTKRELVEYYLSVGEGALRALYDRPTHLKRHPDGVEGEAIYQKRAPVKRPDWVETVGIRFPSGRTPSDLCVTEVGRHRLLREPGDHRLPPVAGPRRRRGPSRRAAHRPRPAARHRLRRGAQGRLRRPRGARRAGLTGFAKTSGSRGIHINVRIEPRWDFTEVRHAGDRPRPRGRAPRARPGHHRVVEGGARRAGLHRLQPERPRPDRGQRLLGAGQAARARSPRR